MSRTHARTAGLLVLFAAVALASCRTASVPTDPLIGTSWRLVSIVDSDTTFSTVPPDQLTFDANGRAVSVSTCNSCRGLYTLGDRTLTISQLACTRRACEPGRLELDRYLTGASRWQVSGDQLTLTVDDDLNSIDATLTFERASN